MHFEGAQDSARCSCKKTDEDIKHVIFRCKKYDEIRPEAMSSRDSRHWGNMSYFLGGKPIDGNEYWSPNMLLVNLTIQFLKNTGRFDIQPTGEWSQSPAPSSTTNP